MRFIPNLIPQNAKVLPDYFKGDTNVPEQPSTFKIILSYIGAIILFIVAVAYIKHPLLTVLFGVLGFVILPQGHRWIEKQLRFRFNTRIKSVFGAALFLGSMPLVGHYTEADKQEAHLLKLQQEKEQLEKLAAERRELQRKDSLNYYLQTSLSLRDENKLDAALKQVDYASRFIATESEKSKVEEVRAEILESKAFALVKAGQFQTALPKLTQLLQQNPDNADALYNRAVCYSRIGKTLEAVTDLKQAIRLGSTEADELHNKINPLKKRVAYYVTRCCDGSTSSAKGRGACSHHGGVCNWNDPVFEEYRQYK